LYERFHKKTNIFTGEKIAFLDDCAKFSKNRITTKSKECTMRIKKLGNSDLEFSAIGLGTWAMGGEGWRYAWGPQDDQQSIRTIQHAFDLGINWIDTAAVYGLGHAEKVVGKALKSMSQKPIIASKCSRKGTSDGQLFSDLKKESIIKEAEESLRRLQIDVIDLYQVHWPKPEDDIEEGWEAMAQLIRDGKVRYGGVSNFYVEHMQRCQSIFPITSLQPPYNMLVRYIEDEILDYCEKEKIGVLCYSPLYKGMFTGAFDKQRLANLPDTDHRKLDPHFQEPELSANLALVDGLKEIAQDRGITVGQLTIAWTLRHPAMTSAIVGGRKPEQLDETATAGDVVLSDDEIAKIDELLELRDRSLF
jgi:aryl-alcohol dehydrogenase-like predicted oxidoreductase